MRRGLVPGQGAAAFGPIWFPGVLVHERRPADAQATAVWLVENTSLTFDQIAEFCKLHPLEVKGIADGEVATGIKGFDPMSSGQLTREEIAACEANPERRLKLATSKTRVPRIQEAARRPLYPAVAPPGPAPTRSCGCCATMPN